VAVLVALWFIDRSLSCIGRQQQQHRISFPHRRMHASVHLIDRWAGGAFSTGSDSAGVVEGVGF
jgi:hypothetical protein